MGGNKTADPVSHSGEHRIHIGADTALTVGTRHMDDVPALFRISQTLQEHPGIRQGVLFAEFRYIQEIFHCFVIGFYAFLFHGYSSGQRH